MASDHYPPVPDQSTAVTEERAVANAQGALELALTRTGGREYLTLTASPRGTVGEKQPVSHLSGPPFLRVRDD
ncbi:hypothetical protein [Haloarcula sp. 1CSR25-25]|uniref:hypothetical protein n=1 Tax=Haloarcula sp. 1CSR25-25 TaxID=2862545 RepID=UPI002894EA86|nr:hypothetical protein [Haloarcula sp. 1CSR25-25]MDT3433924.1 hypothetical protein [Haloarcula sp. 1CSR25-25]